MKVLLVVPPNIKYHYPIIPLGLLYIGSALIKNNIEYEFYDLNFHSSPCKTLTDKLELFEPDIVGFSIRNIAETSKMNDIYNDVSKLVCVAKKFAKVVLGGAGFSIFPKEIMHMTKAEYGIVGPGEAAIVHIINNLKNVPIGSITSKCDESFIKNSISEPMQKYWKQYGKYFIVNEVSIPIQTTRGCVYNCRYCTYPSLSNYSVQRRPVELIIAEIKNIMELTQRDSFYFVDSVFNMDLQFTKELLLAIIKSELNFKWSCCINPMNYDNELITLMKKSGCDHCEVGVDSFSDTQLKCLGKGFNSDNAKQLINNLERNRLKYSISLILGGLGETEETLSETFSVANSFEKAKINAFIGERVYPHTKLAETLCSHSKSQLYEASKDSIYVEEVILPLLKTIIKDASPDRWRFAGELITGEMI